MRWAPLALALLFVLAAVAQAATVQKTYVFREGVTMTGAQDAFIQTKTADTDTLNFGANNILKIGNGVGGAINRAWIKWPDSIQDSIPSDEVIDSAILTLRVTASTSAGAETLRARPCLQDPVEGVGTEALPDTLGITWLEFNQLTVGGGDNSWGSEGADSSFVVGPSAVGSDSIMTWESFLSTLPYDGSYDVGQTVGWVAYNGLSNGDSLSINLTSYFKDLRDGLITNRGLILHESTASQFCNVGSVEALADSVWFLKVTTTKTNVPVMMGQGGGIAP